ncbi:T9SS sorting signal type C domain-containing protein [Flavobacterium sp. KACC 22758]|uniref:T9SS sorting signal type C domain-containing protein n=2 Tax=unclassified Flavobacterium TaxID=196869 RepID=UPI00236721CA|nr:T9SS sorting signal type C domain-containing protein [Flavobacterium sp. KACC 22758]WDF59562.1 T9SS sorting signal type C domain-containing protein [Flavobacterium sp. KACC 22758]
MIRKLLFSSFLFILTFYSFAQTSVSDNASGTRSWVVPAGINSVTVEVWGAGGAGGGSTSNNNGGSGGGGGGYSYRTFAVTSGQTITYTVGRGGAGSTGNGPAGGDSTLTYGGISVTANGGTGGNRNAGTRGTGGNGTTSSGSNGVTGNASGGNGGDAGNAPGTGGSGQRDDNGNPGTSPGGGGGGGEYHWWWGNMSGGNGANGRVNIVGTCTPTPTSQAGSDYSFCIDYSNTQTGTISSGQYAVVNVISGYNYTFSVGNIFSGNENLTLLDSSNNNLTPNVSSSGATGTSITWTANFSGQIRVFLAGSCTDTNSGTMTLTLNSSRNNLDSQTTAGANNTWIGHIYNSTGAAPSPFTTTNYAGYYTIGTENFDTNFGGDYTCFPVFSNGVQRASMYTEGFAVRYRMQSTRPAGCYLIRIIGDDGVRLSINNGGYILDRWVEQGATTYSNILVNVPANPIFTLEYYENAGANRVGFNITPFDAALNTITAPATVNFCNGGDPGVIEGSLEYNSADLNAPNPYINFQWQIQTNGGGFSNISGATGRTYDPPAMVANSTASDIVYQYRRLATSNVAGTGTACNFTESAPITITNSPTSAGGTASDNQSICYGTQPANISLSGYRGNIQWQVSTDNTNFNNIDGATAAVLTGSQMGSLTKTAYYRAITSGACNTATSTVVTITVRAGNNIISYSNGTSGTVCMQPVENATGSLTASAGTYFNNVSFASYGTPTGTTCAAYAINPFCHAATSQSVVESALLGSGNTISIAATNANFTDPCVGTTKRLYVTASYSQSICAGNLPGTITGSIPTGSGTYSYLWESSTTSNTTGFSAASGTNNGQNYTPGTLTQDTWFRRTAYDGACSSLSAVVLVKVIAKVWNGNTNTDWNIASNWTPSGVPTASDCVVIPNTTNKPIINGTNTNSYANTLSVTNLGSLTVNSTNTLNITNAVTVNTGGSLTFNNNSSLVQTNKNAANSGNITYIRQTSVRRYDYTYWSSPLTAASGFTLYMMSPLTLSDKYTSYNPNASWVISYGGGLPMTPGEGYSVRGPQNFDIVTPSIQTASFTGVPNNGDVPKTTVPNKFNLLGNPYPSAINGIKLIGDTNIGTIYLWTHNTPPANDGSNKYKYASADYAAFNLSGSVRNGGDATGPTGYIAAGQGFFAKPVTNSITFTNDMRVGGNNGSFYKTAKTENLERNRVWLNLSNAEGAFKQTLVGYIEGATNGLDLNYDAASFNGNTYVDFYSINETAKFSIQGRALPFENSDVIPLGYKTTIAGDFTISIDHVDGFFDNHNVYLEDKTTGAVSDLKAQDYTFKTQAGTFTDRFALRYTNKTLGTGDFENVKDGLLISVKDKTIKVTSAKENIKEVNIFDITGKLIYNKKKVGNTELSISNLQSADQVLLVKVNLENNAQVTRKVIFK